MYRPLAAALAAASMAPGAWAQIAPATAPVAGPTSTQPAVTLDSVLTQSGAGRAPGTQAGGAIVLPGTAPSLAAPRTALPSVAAATASVDAALAGRTVAGLRPNPQLQGQLENVTGSGIYRGVRNAETTVGLALPLELGGKRGARIALADAQIDRARLQAGIARADLRLRLIQLYVEAVADERRAQVFGEQAKLAADAFRLASDRVQVGDVGPIEQQRADVLRINAQIAADNAARDAAASRVALAGLTGQPVVGTFDTAWFERVDGYGPPRPIAVEGTLALAAAEADVRTAGAQVRVARTLRVPDLTVTAGARRLEGTNDTAAVFGVSIPLPVFNNGRALVAQTQANQTQAQALRSVTVIEVRQAIAQAQAEVANAAATARATGGPGLAAAAEAARIARIGWTQGKFDQLALLDAERTLSQTRSAHVDALAAFHDAQARLERLTTPAPTNSGDQ